MGESWANWAGTVSAGGIEVRHPSSPDEVAAILGEAARTGRAVRPVGSGHSFTAVGRPEDIQIALDRQADAVGLDRSSGLVTVQAGMPLSRLNTLLSAAGLAMPNLGDIDKQTVAGALATGTHGTGSRFGGLATQLRGLELVLPDGTVRRCSAERDPDLFDAARVGLGALGVATAVTLQTVPLFALRAVEGPLRLDDVLDGFDELIVAPDHAEFFWFPHTRWTMVKRNSRVPVDEGLAPLPRVKRWLDAEFLSNSVFGALVGVGARVPGVIPPLNRIASRALGNRTYTDTSHAVFVSSRRVRFVEMEYAVARDVLVDVARELVTAVERSGLRISFPVEVRVAAGDDIPLSTAYGRDSGYIAVHMEPRGPYEEYFRLVEGVLAGASGRPHWGKIHYLEAADLRDRYPRFDAFVAVRDRVDPEGLLSNRYLDRVLGPAPKAVGGSM